MWQLCFTSAAVTESTVINNLSSEGRFSFSWYFTLIDANTCRTHMSYLSGFAWQRFQISKDSNLICFLHKMSWGPVGLHRPSSCPVAAQGKRATTSKGVAAASNITTAASEAPAKQPQPPAKPPQPSAKPPLAKPLQLPAKPQQMLKLTPPPQPPLQA